MDAFSLPINKRRQVIKLFLKIPHHLFGGDFLFIYLYTLKQQTMEDEQGKRVLKLHREFVDSLTQEELEDIMKDYDYYEIENF
ncbi:MAG: hypothetical protein ABWY25_09315 [Paenisporosarcina sp.]